MPEQIKQYDLVQRWLHWLIAFTILAMIAIGLYMVQLPKEWELPEGQESVRAFWFLLHKSLGISIAVLILMRVAWRIFHPAPSLPSSIPLWQQKLSGGVHGLLYVLMIAMPLTGYLQSMYSKYDTKLWGIVLPRLAEADPDMREYFSEIHEVLAFTLIALLLLHIGAAVKHRINNNDITQRMSLFSKK